MNEDFNPRPDSAEAREDPDQRLAGSLEQLLRLRPLGDDEPPQAPASAFLRADGESHMAAVSRPDGNFCPEASDWALLLVPDPDETDLPKIDKLLAHASECNHCAQRLLVISSPATARETAAIADLPSASEAGSHALAARLAQTPRAGEPQRSIRSFLWVGAALAASLLLAVGVNAWWRAASSPEHLLAQAYTQSRIFDLRMPGAGYAEVNPPLHLRSATASREPASLTDAKARVASRLQASPLDPRMLELEARADVLEEKFDAAIDILDRLIARGPVTATLLLDDASGYFQRGLATGNDADRITALDSLRHADELAPGDTVVLFNEAVVMEDRGELMNAVETLNRYLRFERDPQWQAEGRRRLQHLEQKLNQQKLQPGK